MIKSVHRILGPEYMRQASAALTHLQPGTSSVLYGNRKTGQLVTNPLVIRDITQHGECIQ